MLTEPAVMHATSVLESKRSLTREAMDLACVVRDASTAPYKRALAATALGKELDELRSNGMAPEAAQVLNDDEDGRPRTSPRAGGGGGTPIEDALLELVGYACGWSASDVFVPRSSYARTHARAHTS